MLRLYLGMIFLVFLPADTEQNGNCFCKKGNPITPEGYNKYMAPLEAEEKPTPVYINIDIMDIDKITEERMEFSMQFYVNEYWKDPRLNISYGKKSIIPLEWVKDMWTPDIIFDNSKAGWVYSLAIPNIVVQTHHHNYIYRYTRYNMVITCSMYLQSFPMDTQRCYLSISSFTDNTKMQLKWLHEREEQEHVDIQDLFLADIHPLKYRVVNFTSSKIQYEFASGFYTALHANLTFSRHLSSHVINVYLPSGLVVVLSFLSFWLNVSSVPARVALGLTSLLTLSTQASQARAHLPPINYLTALDVWLFVCILLVFLSLIEYATAYHCYSAKIRAKASSPPEAWANVSDGSRTEVRSQNLNSNPSSVKTPKESMGADINEEIQFLDKASRMIFPLSFIVFSLVYWISYLNSSR